jgi:hypothetical protein
VQQGHVPHTSRKQSAHQLSTTARRQQPTAPLPRLRLRVQPTSDLVVPSRRAGGLQTFTDAANNRRASNASSVT